jgi:hypothetical protein
MRRSVSSFVWARTERPDFIQLTISSRLSEVASVFRTGV